MSDELLDIVDNIKQPSVWIRVLFMAVFVVASYILLLPLIVIISIAQALFVLITGKINENLRYFAATLELYVAQIIKFLMYLTELKPFPFSDLPEVEDTSLSESGDSTEKKKSNATDAVTKKSSAKKSVKKKVAKKKASKAKAAKKDSEEDDSKAS